MKDLMVIGTAVSPFVMFLHSITKLKMNVIIVQKEWFTLLNIRSVVNAQLGLS